MVVKFNHQHEEETMKFTRRQWMGASAAGTMGAVVAGAELSPLAKVFAAEPDAAAQLAALKSFSGKVPHATHYGPLVATVEKGRLVKVEPQASDKMRMVKAPSQSHSQEVGIGTLGPSASQSLFSRATAKHCSA